MKPYNNDNKLLSKVTWANGAQTDKTFLETRLKIGYN